jgi:hypothetical protein
MLCLQEDFEINTNGFLDLAAALMTDYADEKRERPEVPSADIISDKFKMLVEATYVEFKNENKNNNIKVNGNNNTLLQDVKASDINININSK